MCSLSLLLGLAAAASIVLALKQHSADIDPVIAKALASQPNLPPEARQIALLTAYAVPSLIIFCLVSSLVSALQGQCSRKPFPKYSSDHVPMGQPVMRGQMGAPPIESNTPYMPVSAPGQWVDGLFACCNDGKLLCAGLFCPCVVVGQLLQRVKGHRGSCVLCVILFTVASIVSQAHAAACLDPKVTCSKLSDGSITCQAAVSPMGAHASGGRLPAYCEYTGGLSSLAWLLLSSVLMLVRQQIRTVYRIAPSCCGPCDDFCCAFCCLPVAACQIMRHVGTHEQSEYNIISATGMATAV